MTRAGKFRLRLLLLVPLVLAGCLGPPPRLDPSAAGSHLQVLVSSAVDSTGSLHPVVEVAVPRRALVFQRRDGRIQGGLVATATIWREGRQLNGDVAKNIMTVDDWQATRSDSLVRCSLSLPLAGTEEALIRVQARPWGTQRNWQRELVYRPTEWLRLPLAFTRFHWNLADPPETGQECDSLLISLGIHSLGPPGQEPKSARVGLIFTGPSGDQVLRLEQPLAWTAARPDSSHVQVFRLGAADLPFGSLQVTPFLVGPGEETGEILRPWRPGRHFTNFQVDWLDDSAWRDQVSWLEGKMPPDLLASLDSVAAENRLSAWREAWQLNLNSDDQEPQEAILAHWRGISAADRKFSGPGSGSHSARGRAYIRYGPPDRIDRQWDDRERHGRWETWYYDDSGLQLIFFDPHGLGEYRLVDTLPAP